MTADQSSPKPAARRWALLAAGVFAAGLALVLLFLLTLATGNRSLYEVNFSWLVGINLAVATFLLLVIAWFLWRLLGRLRKGKFGSRLLVKIVAIFALVGILPGLLIYTVSYQFVSRSIESWFDVRVETALNAGLNLGRTTLDTLAADLSNKTRSAAQGLAEVPNSMGGLALERLREPLGASDLVLWNAQGQALASAGSSLLSLNPERPEAQQLRVARSNQVWAQIEGLDEALEAADKADPPTADAEPPRPARIKVLAWVPSARLALQNEARYLQVVVPLPPALVQDALAVQQANREYQERALTRDGLRRMYIGTLTLSLFLAIFGACLLAVLLGNQLVRPLLVLAAGMREVAAGNLAPKPALDTKDELGELTRTFSRMTGELDQARSAVQRSMAQVSAARSNLQTILDNLTAGVVVLDAQGHILSVNPGANRILRTPLGQHLGQPLARVPGLEGFAEGVLQQFERFLGQAGTQQPTHWQQPFELNPNEVSPLQGGITLIARGAMMPGDERLLVFDDVSEMVSAQRAKAWGEVARRLAHEIKNPLTPIQLSAERMAHKLDAKLQPPDQALLHKSVRTIVDQVEAMKRLVNEFRDYARLPAAQLQPTDLNALVRDILVLYDNSPVPVRHQLAEDCPQVMVDPQQVRQMLHNLIQNAQDAQEPQSAPPNATGPTVPSAVGAPDPGPTKAMALVVVATQCASNGKTVRLCIRDNGPGFAEHILRRAFEPYVTTKQKGTGLGLAVVKKIMEEHGGRVDIGNLGVNGPLQGAQVSLSFAVAN